MITPQQRLIEATQAEKTTLEAWRESDEQKAERRRKAFLGTTLARLAFQPHRGGATKTEPYEASVLWRRSAQRQLKRFENTYLGELDTTNSTYEPEKLRLHVRPGQGQEGLFVAQYHGQDNKVTDLEQFRAVKTNKTEHRHTPETRSDAHLYVLDQDSQEFEPVGFEDEHYQFIRAVTPMFFSRLVKLLEAEGL